MYHKRRKSTRQKKGEKKNIYKNDCICQTVMQSSEMHHRGGLVLFFTAPILTHATCSGGRLDEERCHPADLFMQLLHKQCGKAFIIPSAEHFIMGAFVCSKTVFI